MKYVIQTKIASKDFYLRSVTVRPHDSKKEPLLTSELYKAKKFNNKVDAERFKSTFISNGRIYNVEASL